MKKPYIIAALCLIGIAFFFKTGIANALLLFLLVGAIPGTTFNIPAAGMLFIIMIPIWLIFVRIITLESVQTRLNQKKRPSRKHLEQI